MQEKVKTAFVLGAGLGTRLRPLTEQCPKPLLPMGGRPIVTYAFDHLKQLGIERIIVNTHHCAEKYQEIFPDNQWNGIPLVFVHEPILLETGGGIKNIVPYLQNETLLVYNGDILADFDLRSLLDYHFSHQEEVTLALRSKDYPQHIGLDALGRVAAIRAAKGKPIVQWCLFTGIYLIAPRFLDRLKTGEKKSVIPAFEMMIEEGKGPAGVICDQGRWCDVGSLQTYHAMKERGW
ncbi:MAG: nucleotidyltransferase family protein [Verrucomicrobiae bacterium]|nr:nucleotidyltransferase family protein [Verrucomicrobiae bacterium]